MINLVTLDTQYPPVWSGTAVSGVTPAVDATTALRHTTGDDKVNYFTRQRSEGDLFNRDLANFKMLKELIDHLSTRGGLTFTTPQVSLTTGTHLSLGRFGGLPSEVPEYFVAGLGCFLLAGGTNGSVGVRIVKVSDASLLIGATAKDSITWDGSTPVAPTDLRGTELDGTDPMEAQIYNESGGTVIAQGFAIVRPRNRT